MGKQEEGEAEKGASRVKLNDKAVKAIAAPPADFPRPAVIVWDTEVRGFGVRVTRATKERPEGVRSFILSYRTRGTKGDDGKLTGAGTQRQFTLGRFPDDYRTVSVARKAAQELRRQIAGGGDPMGELSEHRAAPTIDMLADKYLAEHGPKKRPGSLYEDKSLLRQWIRPELGARKVRDIKRADVEALHAKITANGTPTRANRVHSLLSTMFALAIRWEMVRDNPCKNIDKNRENKRTRYLKPDELQRFMAALAEHPNQEGANLLRLLLLTGARKGETMGARWDDFDLAKAEWHKPASTTKQATDHDVPLSPGALQLLVAMRAKADSGEDTAAELERQAAKERHRYRKQALLSAAARARVIAASPYIFPGYAGAEQPLKRNGAVWKDICKAAQLENFHQHDLRHSFASYLAGTGQGLIIIGQLLGHSSPAMTARYAHVDLDPLRAAVDRVSAIVAAAENAAPSAEVKQFPAKGRKR